MKKMIKSISMMLIIMLFATSTAFAATMPKDVADTTWEKAVTALVEAGAITGDEDGLFHAEDNLTRAQACIIIVKTIDPPASMVNGTATQPAAKAGFSDMKGYSWASGYIGYAVQNGIVKGYPDGTFKPGVKVTTNEILTMILRAAGYTEEQIGLNWPDDYIAKAKAEGILQGIDENYSVDATKGMAAQMTYNKFEKLKAAAPVIKDQPQGTETDKATTIPSTSSMTFATGSFDGSMSTFAGKSLSSDVKIYTYGVSSDYSKSMILSDKSADYILDTVYKYKNVKTSAWYGTENNKITSMILPKDVGYSGKAYSVINGTVNAVNVAGDTVTGFNTLTATKEVTWFGEKNLTLPTITAADGQLYELSVNNGVVKNVATAVNAKNKYFVELTGSNINAVSNKVYSYEDNVLRLENADGAVIEVKSNASIYVWDDKDKEYKAGTLSRIKADKQVRVYDVSDDDQTSADVVIIK